MKNISESKEIIVDDLTKVPKIEGYKTTNIEPLKNGKYKANYQVEKKWLISKLLEDYNYRPNGKVNVVTTEVYGRELIRTDFREYKCICKITWLSRDFSLVKDGSDYRFVDDLSGYYVCSKYSEKEAIQYFIDLMNKHFHELPERVFKMDQNYLYKFQIPIIVVV